MKTTVWMTWIWAAIMVLLSGPGCSTNLATGRSQLNVISQDQEISLGKESAPQFLKEYGGPIPSPEIQTYVRDLGMRLARESERPHLPWEFHAVDSAVLNAFALPGGKVFITRGMLMKLTSEAQLAGVLGHEVGHVTAEHIGQQMTRAIGIQAVAVGLGVAGQTTDKQWLQTLGLGAQVGGTVYLLKFGRDQENEADSLGVRYMTRLGYTPLGQKQVMQILAEASKGSGGQPEFLSTHPDPHSRVERLDRMIARDFPDAADESRWKVGGGEYRQQVLDRLAKLPPPRHKGQ